MARLSLNRLTGRSCTVDTQSSLVFEKNIHSYPVVVSNWYVRSTPPPPKKKKRTFQESLCESFQVFKRRYFPQNSPFYLGFFLMKLSKLLLVNLYLEEDIYN